MKDKIKELIQKSLKSLKIDLEKEEISVEIPADALHGDYSSNIAMQLAKKVGKNPRTLAQEIVDSIEKDSDVDKIEVAGAGFVNFYVSEEYLLKIVSGIDEGFGRNSLYKGKRILIEHTSPNPTKAFHLGHLKNNVTGLSISYLFEAMGAEVIRDCIDNNRGIAIAKLMWAYVVYAHKKNTKVKFDINYWFENTHDWKTPESENMDKGDFVSYYYVKGAEDFAESKYEEEMRQLARDWESEDVRVLKLWKIIQNWVWQGFEQVLKRVGGWQFDKIWHESDIYKKGKQHVERGIKEGVFKKLEDGAVVTDFKKQFNLPDTILLKNDGTSLYITQDLELTYLKHSTFNPDEKYWVIGPEQSLAMKQMFAACSQLGFGAYESFHHIAYGFISIKGKNGAEKMSSRLGNEVRINQLIDKAKKDLEKYISSELSHSEIDLVTEKVAIAAIKYSLLRVNRLQDMVFDYETTISLEGDSGAYLMYAYTRAKAILDQAIINEKSSLSFSNEFELSLAKHIAKFPGIVESAGLNLAPNYICEYIYDLAKSFNKFYSECPVLNADSEEERNLRLLLTQATAQVLKNGLKLLGIQTVDKM